MIYIPVLSTLAIEYIDTGLLGLSTLAIIILQRFAIFRDAHPIFVVAGWLVAGHCLPEPSLRHRYREARGYKFLPPSLTFLPPAQEDKRLIN